jgi:ABC-type antimicrobial peptide transport system permease subunit
MMKKKCSKCNDEKDIKEFGNRKNCSGKIIKNSVCKNCLTKKMKEYREKNKEKFLLYDKNRHLKNKDNEEVKKKKKEWYENNKDKTNKWREKNKEKMINYRKQYYKEHREKMLKQNRDNHYKRIKNDNLYKLKHNIKVAIARSFKRNGLKKSSSTQTILGCSFDFFKSHLEKQFEAWMSWNNYGLYNGELNYGWDIDHIIPLSTAKSEEDVVKLNHYTNLQPLCSKINRNIKKKSP